MAYSLDLRERALAFIEATGKINKAIEVFGVSRAALGRWMTKKKQGLSLQDPPPKRPWKKIDPDKLLALVEAHPDWLLSQFAAVFGVSCNAISVAFKKLKITRKKSPSVIKNVILRNAKYFYKKSKQ